MDLNSTQTETNFHLSVTTAHFELRVMGCWKAGYFQDKLPVYRRKIAQTETAIFLLWADVQTTSVETTMNTVSPRV